jgi:hypothetical protein
MWLMAEFEAVTLFSLKLSTATATGGKSLLAPTPYALKMALLDAACRTVNVAQAEAWWPALRDLAVALRPARQVVVTNLFQKVLRPRRNPAKPGEPDAGPFQKTIGYREYVQLVGAWGLALGWANDDGRDWLPDVMLNINYLGKRGSFMQLLAPPQAAADLPSGFVMLTEEQRAFALAGTLQVLDDCGPSLTFAKANVYSDEKLKPGKDRLARNIVLPYRLSRSSKAFSLYELSWS